MIAAFDVGGTKVAAALFDDGGVVWRGRWATPGPPGARDPGSRTLRAAAAELAVRSAAPVTGVGVGFCEFVHEGRLTSREVIAWDEQPADWLRGIFPGAAVEVESDVRCGLLAELRAGAAPAPGSALYVCWGTGLSSAFAVGDRVWTGARGRAIALGRVAVPGASDLETFASGEGLRLRYAELTGRRGSTARQVLVAADAGDDAAAAVADSAGAALGDALAGLVHVLDPAVVVLGGGLGSATGSRAWRALGARWAAHRLDAPLVVGALGADGPLVGAALVGGWRCPDPPAGAQGALRNRSAVNW